MSDTDSDVEAENGAGTDSASVAPSTLAALRSQHLKRLIEENDWHNQDCPDFRERFLAGHHSLPELDEHVQQQLVKRAESSTSSMAVSVATTRSSAVTSRHSAASLPSLDSRSTWYTEKSARTSRADSILSLEVLGEDTDGALEVASTSSQRVLACALSFLNCPFTSHELEEWDTHCKSHFYGHLPQSVQCPFRCDWTWRAATGELAWHARIIHIWSEHRYQGVVDTGRWPDSSLVEHLWKKGIIDNAQMKELRAKGCCTGQVFLTSAGSLRDERTQRRPRAAVRS